MEELSRNTLFADEVLGLKPQLVLETLQRVRVAVAVDERWAASRPGQLMLVAATNILARLFDYCPNLDVIAPSEARARERIPPLQLGELLAEGTRRFLEELPKEGFAHSYRALARSEGPYDVALLIGSPDVEARQVIHIASEGWRAYAGTAPPPLEPSLGDPNPLGALIAAGWGASLLAAEIFRPFKPTFDLPSAPAARWFSAFDYTADASGPNPALPERIDIREVIMVGGGALGSAATYTLAALPDLLGFLSIVDYDTLSSTNIERHFTSTRADASSERHKVKALRDLLERYQRAVEVSPVDEGYEDWPGRTKAQEIALLGPDDAAIRRTVQFDLPRIVINAATSGSMFTVSRHDFLTGPCTACLYPDNEKTSVLVEDVARQFGVDLQIARDLVEGQRVFDSTIYQAMCERGTAVLREERARELFGLSLDEVRGVVCSEAEIRPELPAATIGFVSFLPGVLMVAELIKERCFPSAPLSSDTNVFQGDAFCLGDEKPYARRKTRKCRCNDDILQGSYRRRWMVTDPVASC